MLEEIVFPIFSLQPIRNRICSPGLLTDFHKPYRGNPTVPFDAEILESKLTLK